jgi:8-oxo-dGTP pyrophosphatase MutT (NUDIX family)
MSHTKVSPDDLTLKIKEILADREVKQVAAGPGLIRAAVLLPLFIKDGSCHILFTKRTDKVRHHKGEISFPGGIYDATDKDLLATALREAHEEIGLKPQDVDLLGALDEMMTMTDFIVSPFVGLIPYPYTFIPSHEEIDEIIILPLSGFLKEGVLSEEYRTYNERTEKVSVYQCSGHVIWGATAKILRQFLELIPTQSKGGLT